MPGKLTAALKKMQQQSKLLQRKTKGVKFSTPRIVRHIARRSR